MADYHKKGGLASADLLTKLSKERGRKIRFLYESNPKFCLECSSPLSYEKRRNNFCNSSCGASYNNRVFPKRAAVFKVIKGKYLKKNVQDNFCLFCAKVIASYRIYCSQSCHNEQKYLDYIERWLKGEEKGYHDGGSYGISKYIRRWIREKYGEKCSLCGWHEKNLTTGNVPVEIDHIDGDASNNKPENLRLLCPNCHSLTPTYRALNKISVRKHRKTPS